MSCVGITTNCPVEVAVPPDVVTASGPVVAVAGTTAVSVVAFWTVKLAAAMPLKVTAETPVKFAPVSVTVVPARPFVGVKLAIVGGGGVTVMVLFALVAFRLAVIWAEPGATAVTVIGALV